MQIRDRIKELRRVRAKELCPNPRNWRTHGKRQREVLRGILAEVGYADALLARELPDGRLMLIDGHLRAETTPEQEVPVLVLDVDEQEAEKLLAMIDPIAALAGRNDAMLAELAERLDFESDTLGDMLKEMTNSPDLVSGIEPAEPFIPELYQVVIECDDETQQRELYEKFRGEGLRCKVLNL